MTELTQEEKLEEYRQYVNEEIKKWGGELREIERAIDSMERFERRTGMQSQWLERYKKKLARTRWWYERQKDELGRIQQAELQELRRQMAELKDTLPDKPERPPKPTRGHPSTLDPWFEWRRAVRALGFKYTLKDLARETGYSYGYVKNKHLEWKSENT